MVPPQLPYHWDIMLKRLAILVLMTAAATEGQRPAEVRTGVVTVVVSETYLYGELYLQVEAVPSYLDLTSLCGGNQIPPRDGHPCLRLSGSVCLGPVETLTPDPGHA